MTGVLVTTYGALPGAFVSAAEAILGPQEALRYVAVRPNDTPQEIRQHLHQSVDVLLEVCDSVLVLVGVYGESDCLLCQSLFSRDQVQIVTGANLPMIFKVLTYRKALTLDVLAKLACETGQAGIRIVEPTGASTGKSTG